MIRARKSLSELEAQVIGKQLLLAIGYLHAHNVMHRDLKLSNILISQSMEIKVADFGLAYKFETRDERRYSFCGTPAYVAPEMVDRERQEGHCEKVDIWAFGILMYVMLCGRPPFWSKSNEKTFKMILNGDVAFPEHVSEEARNMIEHCLRRRPEKRPTAEQIL
jgi:polo-like kinase 4